MKTSLVLRPAAPSRSLAISLILAALTVTTASAQLKVLPGHVPIGVSKLPTSGILDPSQRLNLAIGLPLRHQSQLTNLLDQLYNPASPNWHRFLTVEQFT
ncbi:MAG: protease pro-enzyme activation domain-containing protein, partial [Limisphaerales bacterium]